MGVNWLKAREKIRLRLTTTGTNLTSFSRMKPLYLSVVKKRWKHANGVNRGIKLTANY